jgi:hypothetical protein
MVKNRQIRLLERAQSSSPFNSFRILHGRLNRSESAPCRHGEAPAAEHSIWAMPLRIPRVRPQASYLKESATRVRNAATFPFSTFMSILEITQRARCRFHGVAAGILPRRLADTDHVDDPVDRVRLLFRHRILRRSSPRARAWARCDVNIICGTNPPRCVHHGRRTNGRAAREQLRRMRTDALNDHVCSWQKRTCALLTGVRVFDPELKWSTTAQGEGPTHTLSPVRRGTNSSWRGPRAWRKPASTQTCNGRPGRWRHSRLRNTK